jgi:hypothetical protein
MSKKSGLIDSPENSKFCASRGSKQLIEPVETSVISLREGNIDRYRLNLQEYEKWHSLLGKTKS